MLSYFLRDVGGSTGSDLIGVAGGEVYPDASFVEKERETEREERSDVFGVLGAGISSRSCMKARKEFARSDVRNSRIWSLLRTRSSRVIPRP